MSLKKTYSKEKQKNKNFFIVGIGASAGGVEAIAQLLSNLPANPGMAFIVAQHLDPTHKSMGVSIFSKKTDIIVLEAKNGMRVRADHVYLTPPNHVIHITNGNLKLLPRTIIKKEYHPINSFFQSLAKDQKQRAIGIILSGTGSDGTMGIQSIKAAGGLTIAQDPTSAKYDGMPKSAIETGAVNVILPAPKIAKELLRIAQELYPSKPQEIKVSSDNSNLSHTEEKILFDILTELRTKCNVDFTHYKHSTLKRRIKRRMVVQKKETLKEYFNYLRENIEESKSLFADILINVTDFFRDIKCFDALKKKILPKLLKDTPSNHPLRIWVVGCATGEEVYSVAISLFELAGKTLSPKNIQIFATDISETVIQHARTGIYPESIHTKISKGRLQKFFEKTATGYRIQKAIREICLFSIHDVTKDPPFSKIDFICCRNLLIYFDAPLQKYILSIFHYALNPNGFLWLGSSESTGQSTLFNIIDKKNKLFSRVNSHIAAKFPFPLNFYTSEKIEPTKKIPEKIQDVTHVQRETDRITSSLYGPPAVVVNSEMEIVLIKGNTTPYLQLNPGHASFHLFKMVRPEIVSDIRSLIREVKKKNGPAKKNGIMIEMDQHLRKFNLEVIPLNMPPLTKEHYFLISFEPCLKNLSHVELENSNTKNKKRRLPQKTVQELSEIKVYHQALVQEFEATQEELTSSNEELQSTNEELQSTNEELQSTNEELETAKEELQSINEELTTVNDELHTRNSDLAQLNNDLTNLIGCIDIPLVIVSVHGYIRRFTSKASKIMNLISSDIGRPISDFKPNINIENLEQLVLEVIEVITPKEIEVQDREGKWFRLHVRPYKTTDNRIDGAVISLIDINTLKKNLESNQYLLDYTTSIVNTVPFPVVVLDPQLRLNFANTAFYKKFNIVEMNNELMQRDFFSLFDDKIEATVSLRKALKEVLSSNTPLENCEIQFHPSSTERNVMLLNAQKIHWLEENRASALLLSILDITLVNNLQKDLTEAMVATHRASQAKDVFLAALSHELRTPLTSILSWTQLLQTKKTRESLEHGLEVIEQNALIQAKLIDDLLDISRIQSGKLILTISHLDPSEVVQRAVESVQLLAEEKPITLRLHIKPLKGKVAADPARLQQIVWNLLTNAIKFSRPKGIIDIYVHLIEEKNQPFACIKIVDYGKGINANFLPQIFERFTQAEEAIPTFIHGGLGIGLSIVKDLVKLIGGSIKAESDGDGKGSTFTVMLPLISEVHTLKEKINDMAYSSQFSPITSKIIKAYPSFHNLKILIVEDKQDALEAFAALLASSGAIPIPAQSAAEALIALDKHKPDLIISDISMPHESGYSLIHSVRTRKAKDGGNIKAIALTALATQEEIDRALSAGFDAHIGKPFKAEDLFNLIEKVREKKNDHAV